MADSVIDIIIEAKDQASSTLKSIGSAASSMGTSALEAGKQALQLGAAAGAALTAAASYGVSAAASFEQTRIGIETMLGSADKARDLMSELTKFAADTPFEFSELASTTKQLLAFGVANDDVIDKLTMLGNIASGLNVPISQLSLVYGQVKAAGKLAGQDLLQFVNAGVPMLQLLADQTGKTTAQIKDDISAGLVSFDMVDQALNTLGGSAGEWGDMMEKQSTSLSGLYSTLKDTVSLTLMQIIGISSEGDVRAGSMFDKLRTAAAQLIAFMNAHQQQFVNAVNAMVDVIQSRLNSAIDGLRAAYSYLEPFISRFSDEIRGAATAVGIVIPVLGIAAAAIGFLSQPIVYVSIAVAAAAAAFIWMKEKIEENGPVIQAMRVAMEPFVIIIKDIWKNITESLVPAFQKWWDVISVWLVPVMKAIAVVVGVTLYAALLLATEAVDAAVMILTKFLDIGTWVNEKLESMFSWVSKVTDKFGALGDAIKNISFSNFKEGLGSLADSVFGGFRAGGGSVTAGTGYIVGERGPEYFVPGSSGAIIPNDQMGGSGSGVTINFNGSVNVDSDDRLKQLADLIAQKIGRANVRAAQGLY